MQETENTISSFRHESSFLSNFFLTDVKYKGVVYSSAEHAFQAEKCIEESDREKIRKAASAKSAKIIGRFVKMRPDWETEKTKVMESILRVKFRKASLRRLLKQTGDAQLIEMNYWHDTFWGVCVCSKHKRSGQNQLGAILMKIRDEEIH